MLPFIERGRAEKQTKEWSPEKIWEGPSQENVRQQIEHRIRAGFAETWRDLWDREYLNQMLAGYDAAVTRIVKENSIPEILLPLLPGKDIYSISEYIKWIAEVIFEVQRWSLESYSEHVKKALKKIRSSYMQELSSQEIAEYVGISNVHLRTLMKKETGKSISEHLTQIRMEVARKMIESGEYYIYEVACRTGYNNVSYFCEVFKKETGTYPSGYRKGKEDAE